MADLGRYTCEEVFRQLNDYLDRELSPNNVAALERHLDDCAPCADQHDFEATVLEELKLKLRKLSLPPSLADKVSAAIERARREPG